MHILDMVYFWARTMPRHPALIQPAGIVTYRTFVDAIETAAAYFAQHTPDRSRPVAVAVADPLKMLVACFGLFRAGVSVVPVTESLLEKLPAAGANTLVYERDGNMLADGTNILFDDRWVSFGASSDQVMAPLRQPKIDDVSMYYFTSGTTGRPKLVVQNREAWEQRMLLSNNTIFANYERAMIVPGLSGAYGFNRACEVLHAGKSACFAPFGLSVLHLIDTYGIDMMIVSPQQALALAEMQEKMTKLPLAALKTIRVGGALMSRDGAERVKNYLCRNIVMSYASTEAGTAAIAPYDAISDIQGAVGFVLPGVDVQVVDHMGQALPIGQEGFICLRSPQYLKSYGNDPATQWFYPGDIGSLTEHGVLCIAGRSGDVINRGGVKLSVTDFEFFLMAAPGVADAGVCTLMGESGTGEVWVGIVFKPAADIEEFRRYVESDEKFGRNIDKLFVVESVPRGELGKVQRPALQEMLTEINASASS